ncbi:hypothetical protein [Shewanella oncorhynchi]|uniref:hypothetical protein n=1 Tax=Shewanella oncorhynchi TaxID=2726434 RepID=UPI002E7BDE0C|nr:hypothetical protein [Shewanella oncorhynchi]WVI94719.1 hypothetical protein VR487_07090 [Shewanella oncorhynchi]
MILAVTKSRSNSAALFLALSVIRYPLSVIRYPLSVIRYPLSVIRYPASKNAIYLPAS